jgi:hypothetical protein
LRVKMQRKEVARRKEERVRRKNGEEEEGE